MIDLSFQEDSRYFFLPFKETVARTSHTGFFLLRVEKKNNNNNIISADPNFFDIICEVYLYILSDDNKDIFAAAVLMTPIVMTTIYNSCSRYSGKHKVLSDGIVPILYYSINIYCRFCGT